MSQPRSQIRHVYVFRHRLTDAVIAWGEGSTPQLALKRAQWDLQAARAAGAAGARNVTGQFEQGPPGPAPSTSRNPAPS